MDKSPEINELAVALCKAQQQIKPAEMTSTNPFHKSKYADLGSVIKASRDALYNNGLSVSQLVGGNGGDVSVTTVLMHNSGQYISDTVSLNIGDAKNHAQEAGKIVTYLRRYAMAAILGMYADEDTDGNQHPVQRKQEQKHRRYEMKTTFDTLQDAINAGFRPVNQTTDKDVTQRPYRGYDFENSDGQETVDVWLRNERNKAGGKGCIRAMFPPVE